MMWDFHWSPAEKKIARRAFDLALSREMEAIRRHTEERLARLRDPHDIWQLHDYLSEQRREIGSKYDYRYSQLALVFVRLISEGWLAESDLAGLSSEKLDLIKQLVSIRDAR